MVTRVNEAGALVDFTSATGGVGTLEIPATTIGNHLVLMVWGLREDRQINSVGIGSTGMALRHKFAGGEGNAQKWIEVWTGVATSSVTEATITLNNILAFDTDGAAVCLEYSGGPSEALALSGTPQSVYQDTSSTSVSVPAVTPASNDSLFLVSMRFGGGPGTFTEDPDFTTLPNAPSVAFRSAERIQLSSSTAQGYDASWTTGRSTNIFGLLALDVASAAATATITSTTRLQSGKGFTITGTNFAATGNSVLISPTDDSADVNAEVQTVDAESTTEITTDPVVLPTGANPGGTIYVFVDNGEGYQADGFAVLVADPVLRLDDTLRDTDSGDLVTDSGLEAVVLSGAAGSRAIAYQATNAAVVTGVCEIQNAAFSIDELTDTYLVTLYDDGAPVRGGGPYTATVVDRNDD